MACRLAAMALILAVSGCSLFHSGPTPQQQFLDALNRGNSAQASQIWLGMTPEDRNKFQRGQGMTPAASPEEITKMLNERGVETDQGLVTIGPRTGASLLDLPAAAGATPASPDAH